MYFNIIFIIYLYIIIIYTASSRELYTTTLTNNNIPSIIARLNSNQYIGQLFGLKLETLLICNDHNIIFDNHQLNLIIDIYCISMVYITSLNINTKNCNMILNIHQLKKILEDLTNLYTKSCITKPIYFWLPHYSDTITSFIPNELLISGFSFSSANNPELVYKYAQELANIAKYIGLHAITGFNLQKFNRNNKNDLLTSFGDDLSTISKLNNEFIKGLQNSTFNTWDHTILDSTDHNLIPGHEWADVYTSPWLPPTVNVKSSDNIMDDEPDIDLGLDELTLNGDEFYVNSGSWGDMKINIAAASPLFTHIYSELNNHNNFATDWTNYTSFPMFYSDNFLNTEIYPPFRSAVATGISIFFADRKSDLASILSSSHKYLQEVLRGGSMRFGGIIIGSTDDVKSIIELKMAETQIEAFTMFLSSCIDIHLMSEFDNEFLKTSLTILDAAKYHNSENNEINEMLSRHHLNYTHLDVKVRRILGFKRSLGLFDLNVLPVAVSPDIENIVKIGNSISKDSITVVQNLNKTLPIDIAVDRIGLLVFSKNENLFNSLNNILGKSKMFILSMEGFLKNKSADYFNEESKRVENFMSSNSVVKIFHILEVPFNFESELIHFLSTLSQFHHVLTTFVQPFNLNSMDVNYLIPSSNLLNSCSAFILLFCHDSFCCDQFANITIGFSFPNGKLPFALLGYSSNNKLKISTGSGSSYSSFSLSNFKTVYFESGEISRYQTLTSQSVPTLKVFFDLELQTNHSDKASIFLYAWPEYAFPLPPNPYKIHSIIKSDYLSRGLNQQYTFILPATNLLFSNEYGHPRLHRGSLNLAISLSPILVVPKINSSNLLITKIDLNWNLKPAKLLAPCVHFTIRKQSSITDVMSAFLAIATIAGCILGIVLKIAYDRCLDATEDVRKLHAIFPIDPIARAARQVKDRSNKGISGIQVLDIESLPNINDDEVEENDGVGFIHDNDNPQSWRNFFTKKTGYNKIIN